MPRLRKGGRFENHAQFEPFIVDVASTSLCSPRTSAPPVASDDPPARALHTATLNSKRTPRFVLFSLSAHALSAFFPSLTPRQVVDVLKRS